MISQLPAEALSELRGKKAQLLDLIYDICRNQAKKSKSGASYDFSSQAWSGKRVGCTREWANKTIRWLVKEGYLISIRRRKYRGLWQTNLYKIGWKCLIYLRRCHEAVRALVHRVNSPSHIVKKTTVSTVNQLTKVLLRNHFREKNEDITRELTELCQRHGGIYQKI